MGRDLSVTLVMFFLPVFKNADIICIAVDYLHDVEYLMRVCTNKKLTITLLYMQLKIPSVRFFVKCPFESCLTGRLLVIHTKKTLSITSNYSRHAQ